MSVAPLADRIEHYQQMLQAFDVARRRFGRVSVSHRNGIYQARHPDTGEVYVGAQDMQTFLARLHDETPPDQPPARPAPPRSRPSSGRRRRRR